MKVVSNKTKCQIMWTSARQQLKAALQQAWPECIDVVQVSALPGE